FLESAVFNTNDSFWEKNDLSLNVDIKIGSKDIQSQVMADHVEGTAGRLAVNHPILLSYIPSNGEPLSIGVNFVRSDKNDFIPKLLGILTGSQNNSAITQYATAAVPFLQLAGDVGSQIYNLIASNHGEKYVSTGAASTLSPSSGNPDRYTLRDCFMLMYSGPEDMGDDAV